MRIPIQTEGTRRISTTSGFVGVGIVAAQDRRPRRGRPLVGTLVEQSPQFTAIPVEKEALCCGSVDPVTKKGENCAELHPFTACIGEIFACPKGEILTSQGDGYCA
jgi:hypothetical protein